MEQEDWIKKLLEHRPNGFDPLIEKHYNTEEGLKYGSWDKYQGQTSIDERSVFPNEIVIDIDAEDTETAVQENRKVLTFLDSNGFDYIVADTGGTGFHIHLFFQYKGVKLEDYRKYRLALFKYLKEKCREEVNAETELWDEQPVRFDIEKGKGHLVRALGGRKKETRHRKTLVQPSTLKKQEITEKEEVEYPERLPWMIKISKTGTTKSDLSIQEIQEYVEKAEEEEKEIHKKEVNADIDTKIKGIEDVRDIPASKVLQLLGIDHDKNKNFKCPFHDDENPSANIYTRNKVERLYCFSDSCTEEKESTPHVWNAVDIMMDYRGMDFKEAVKELGNQFDIEVSFGYDARDYFDNNVQNNLVFQPKKMADELMDEYRFKNVEKLGLYIWRDDYWQKITEDNNIIASEVNKRLGNETKAAYRNNVESVIRNEEEIQVSREEFQNPEKMIPFQNGVYDLEEDKLKDHKPGYNFTFKYNAVYDPSIESNGVQKFIEDIAPESQEKQKKLKEIAAVAIAPWKVNQKVPILHGQGANGKNQYVNILFKIVGKENYHKTDAYSLQNDKFETKSILDKQVAFFDEFEDASRPGKLKGIVGDSDQKVREMHKESYTVETSVYGIFAANELPNPKDNSDGFYRRWEIIDFNQKFTSEEGDGNPDKLQPWQLEEKYMTEEDINCFATELVGHLKDVVDRGGDIINQRTPEETRRVWNRKSGNAVYAFIDKYLTQGRQPYKDQDSDGGDDDWSAWDVDWIAKDDMLDIVNEYLQFYNNSSIRKDQLTRAFNNHPDLDVDCNYRPTTKDGDRVMAYGGVKFDPENVRDVKVISTSLRAHARGALQKLNHANWVDIPDNSTIRDVLLYLHRSENSSASLFELVRNLELQHEDLKPVNNSKYIQVEQEETNGTFHPVYSLNEEKVEQLKEKAERIELNNQKIIEKIEELDDGDGVSIDDVIEEFDDFVGENVEQIIENLENDGTLYEPEPGVVQKL